MIQAQPKTNDLLEQMNAIRKRGMVVPLDFSMMRIKREIESIKHADEVDYHQLMSAFYALTGKHDEMNRFCLICMNKYQDEESILFAAASYSTAGFYTEAVQALSRLDFKCPSSVDSKSELAEGLFQVKMFEMFTHTLSVANVLTEHINRTFAVFHTAGEILSRRNISQASVDAMLDLAWKVMRDHHILVVRNTSVLPAESDDTLTIMIPIALPAATVAKMDWEYTERLFAELPDAPTQSVFIGFMTNDPAH
ncbi:hypothetical protein OYT1_ch1607 [Ferriphaselus amnicola]|uniref:Uncharacterized protein n=1 Tax=Ferriphaselus amnicola TaxID=1188319 RepID=A0A2Z6GCQ0_9PROT|nr:hypothetical protein [Ferriphaselus amnicola]BBE51154.1 hypothetical protein OYT1_ch1607 [Ferriphaselus amnicola]